MLDEVPVGQEVAAGNEGVEAQASQEAETPQPEVTVEELKGQTAGLKKQLAERDRAITRLKRDAQAYDALAEKVELLGVKHDALAEASIDYEQDSETKRANYQAKVKEAQAKTRQPEWTPAQAATAKELREILTSANVDPASPPEELTGVIARVNDLFWGGLHDRAIAVMEKGISQWTVKPQTPERARVSIPQDRTPSQGGRTTRRSWKLSEVEALSPKEYAANREEIDRARREGRLDLTN